MSNFADLLLKVGKLKSIKRSGWVREGMPDPESVAAHTFRVAFLSMLLGDELNVDKDKLIQMALLHDIEEIETLDPVVQRGNKEVGQHDKVKEKAFIENLFKDIENTSQFVNLWEEQSKEKTSSASKEAEILYEIGKLATCWQALEYEIQGADSKKLDEFWVNAKTHIKHPVIKKWLDELESQRKQS